jgi:hypothetical protein
MNASPIIDQEIPELNNCNILFCIGIIYLFLQLLQLYSSPPAHVFQVNCSEYFIYPWQTEYFCGIKFCGDLSEQNFPRRPGLSWAENERKYSVCHG